MAEFVWKAQGEKDVQQPRIKPKPLKFGKERSLSSGSAWSGFSTAFCCHVALVLSPGWSVPFLHVALSLQPRKLLPSFPTLPALPYSSEILPMMVFFFSAVDLKRMGTPMLSFVLPSANSFYPLIAWHGTKCWHPELPPEMGNMGSDNVCEWEASLLQGGSLFTCVKQRKRVVGYLRDLIHMILIIVPEWKIPSPSSSLQCRTSEISHITLQWFWLSLP